MKIISNQHLFSSDDISLYYLSPYIDVRKTDDGLLFINNDLEDSVLIEDNENHIVLLIERLRDGMAEHEIIEYISEYIEEDPETWITFLIQEGIIE